MQRELDNVAKKRTEPPRPKILSFSDTKMTDRYHASKHQDLTQDQRQSQTWSTFHPKSLVGTVLPYYSINNQQNSPQTKPSHVPGQPGCPPTRCQDPQLNLFMKCSGLRTRLWVRAQNGRSPKVAPKTALQEALLEPSCIQQSLHQRALRSLGGTTT